LGQIVRLNLCEFLVVSALDIRDGGAGEHKRGHEYRHDDDDGTQQCRLGMKLGRSHLSNLIIKQYAAAKKHKTPKSPTLGVALLSAGQNRHTFTRP
jgi:hypothetical protein